MHVGAEELPLKSTFMFEHNMEILDVKIIYCSS